MNVKCKKESIIDAVRFSANWLVVAIHLMILLGSRVENSSKGDYAFWNWISQSFAPIAMPTLFFISGYLFYQCSDYVYKLKLKHRIGRLVVPYFIWNFMIGVLFVVLCIMGINKATSADLTSPVEILSWIGRKTLSLWSAPADMPTWYMRTIMVYCIFGPILSFFIKGKCLIIRFLILSIGISLFEYWILVSGRTVDFLYTYPPYSLLCFCAGGVIAFSGYGIEWLYGKYRIVWFLVGFGLLIISTTFPYFPEIDCWFKLSEVMILFSVAPELVKVYSCLPEWIRGSSFWLYVTHLPIFLFLSGFIPKLPFDLIAVRLIIGVSLMMIISIGSFVLLKKIFPRVASVLNGQLKI